MEIKRISRLIIFLAASFCITTISANSPINCESIDLENLNKLEELYKQFDEYEFSNEKRLAETIYNATDSRTKKYQVTYSECIKPLIDGIELNRLDSVTLEELFSYIVTAQFYSSSPKAAKDLLRVYKSLDAKKDVNDMDEKAKSVIEALVRSRLFSELQQFQTRYKVQDQIKIPALEGFDLDESERSILSLSKNGQSLVKQSFVLPSKGHLIVISHPMCNFSANARQWINENKSLKAIFEQSSTWLTPNDGNLYLDKFVAENKGSNMPYYYSFSRSEWPEIDYWGTPAFYFYQAGELKYKFIGWPKEGREKELIKALTIIGLL